MRYLNIIIGRIRYLIQLSVFAGMTIITVMSVSEGLENKAISSTVVYVKADSGQSGPPLALYSRSVMDLLECPESNCKVMARYGRGTRWMFPGTPSGSWYKVNGGYVRASQLVPVQPKDCSKKVYRMDKADGRFWAEGFNDETLVKLIKDAMEQWNSAANRTLLEYDEDSSDAETIDFIADDFYFAREYPEEFGGVYVNRDRKIHIFTRGFLWTDKFIGTPSEKKERYQYVLMRIIMHELGHAIGLGHLKNPDAIMCGGLQSRLGTPSLTRNDIEYLRNVCDE